MICDSLIIPAACADECKLCSVGILVKAGGQEGTKKKKTRFFTLGNEMIAYFDAKNMKGATAKNLKGEFPVTAESKVEMLGLVDGKQQHLPWQQGYAFEITSSGRTFQLYAETEVRLAFVQECNTFTPVKEAILTFRLNNGAGPRV
eukprot:SAG31_NODE_784_length_12112_cov_10.538666_8_plen_146_part_00